jgi:hypothetical protein
MLVKQYRKEAHGGFVLAEARESGVQTRAGRIIYRLRRPTAESG